MTVTEALHFKVFFMGAREDDTEKLEVIDTLQHEVLRLRKMIAAAQSKQKGDK